MNNVPLEIINEIFTYLDVNELMKYRLVSQNSKLMIELLFKLRPMKCNSKVEKLVIFQYVRYIDLQMCRQITDHELKYLKNAECVNLCGCLKITDRGLRYLKNVKEINLAGCYKITDEGLRYLKNIRFIDISYCHNITGSGMARFNKCPTVVMNDCSGIDQSNINILAEFGMINIVSNNDHTFLRSYSKQVTVYPVTNKKDNDDDEVYVPIKYATPEIIKKINLERGQLYNAIYCIDEQNRDKIFMQDYCALLPNANLLNYDEALGRMRRNEQILPFIENLRIYGMDVLIGGSFGLSCVYKNTDFIPNDFDMYIKEIDKEKLLLFEDIIYKSFLVNKIVVIRSAITMTWYVQLMDDTIITIQVNILYIRAWSEIFVTYHTDLTCIGYEIMSKKFIYLRGRWENILVKKNHYFTNILNLDCYGSICNACDKYRSRGFNCIIAKKQPHFMDDHKQEFIKGLMIKYYGIITGSTSGVLRSVSDRTPKNCLPNILYEKYYDTNNLAYASSVDYLFDYRENVPDIRFLSVYKVDLSHNDDMNDIELSNARFYFKMPSTICNSFGKFCNYFRERYTVGVRCPLCSNTISLKSYLDWSDHQNSRYYHKCNDLCKHFHASRDPWGFDYKWYPEIIIF